MEFASCVHRGSQRKTCCGTPELFICRKFGSDCVITQENRFKIIQDAHPSGRQQAESIRVLSLIHI